MIKPILYVEDEESDAFFLKLAFKRIGIDDPFTLLSDGEQAIRYLAGEPPFTDRQAFPLPSVLLLDLNLPRKSAFEVLQWCSRSPSARTLPALIFTSSSSPQDIQRAAQLGAAGYVTKSSDPGAWTTCAQAIRDFWLEHCTLPPQCQLGPLCGRMV